MGDVFETLADFSGQSIIVVGATGALGSATALRLAKLGANVVMTGANAERLAELQKEIEAIGADVSKIVLRLLHQPAFSAAAEHLR